MGDRLGNGVVDDDADGGADQIVTFLQLVAVVAVVCGSRLMLVEQVDAQ